MNVHPEPFKVAALGMEQRTYNTLQLFFSDRCDNHYVLSDEKSADIFIIDMDGYQASKVLENYRKNYPQQPVIVVSLKDNVAQDLVFVRKPIQLAALSSALSEAQRKVGQLKLQTQSADAAQSATIDSPELSGVEQGDGNELFPLETDDDDYQRKDKKIDRSKQANAESLSFENTYSGDTISESKIQYFVNSDRLNVIRAELKKNRGGLQDRPAPRGKNDNTKSVSQSAEEFKAAVNDSGIRFVGDLKEKFNPRNPRLISSLQYSAEMTLQGYVSLAYKIALTSSSNVMVEGPWRPILILFKTKEISVERDFRHLFALSTMTFKKEDVFIYGPDRNGTATLSDQMVVQPIEQFLWKLALRTSQGRVPQGTDLETPVKLIRWPNFTRYEVTPHAMRIAGLWAKHPTSLVETAKILAIPQQYVFAFYSAVFATNMVTQVTADKPEELKPPLVERNPHRNIFQNLLDRLRRL